MTGIELVRHRRFLVEHVRQSLLNVDSTKDEERAAVLQGELERLLQIPE